MRTLIVAILSTIALTAFPFEMTASAKSDSPGMSVGSSAIGRRDGGWTTTHGRSDWRDSDDRGLRKKNRVHRYDSRPGGD